MFPRSEFDPAICEGSLLMAVDDGLASGHGYRIYSRLQPRDAFPTLRDSDDQPGKRTGCHILILCPFHRGARSLW